MFRGAILLLTAKFWLRVNEGEAEATELSVAPALRAGHSLRAGNYLIDTSELVRYVPSYSSERVFNVRAAIKFTALL